MEEIHRKSHDFQEEVLISEIRPLNYGDLSCSLLLNGELWNIFEISGWSSSNTREFFMNNKAPQEYWMDLERDKEIIGNLRKNVDFFMKYVVLKISMNTAYNQPTS